MGLRTFSVQKFAEMLKEALPDILSPEKAQRAAGELVETAPWHFDFFMLHCSLLFRSVAVAPSQALVGEIGRAVVLGDSRDKAYRCRDRLQAMLPDLEAVSALEKHDRLLSSAVKSRRYCRMRFFLDSLVEQVLVEPLP